MSSVRALALGALSVGWLGCATTGAKGAASALPAVTLDEAVADVMRGNQGLCDLFFHDERLDEDVSRHSLALGQRTFASLGLPDAELVDILFSGSLASYEYTRDSDVDVHVVVRLGPSLAPEARPAFMRVLNGLLHDDVGIRFRGRAVQVTVLDVDDDQGGAWSVLKGAWHRRPEHNTVHFPEADLRQAIAAFQAERAAVLDAWAHHDATFDCQRFAAPGRRLKKLRGEGLKAEGVVSLGNMTYRLVRRLSALDELWTLQRACEHAADSL
jgi:hypothetical protein